MCSYPCDDDPYDVDGWKGIAATFTPRGFVAGDADTGLGGRKAGDVFEGGTGCCREKKEFGWVGLDWVGLGRTEPADGKRGCTPPAPPRGR